MADLSPIHELVRRARSRLRWQGALEGAATATILAAAGSLTAIVLVRTGVLSTTAGIVALLGAVAMIAAGALAGALRLEDDEAIARRIDRVSGLSDRLSSAIAFEREAIADDFREAAIDDAVRAVERARVEEATPFRTPRDLRAAAAFVVVSALVAGIAVPGAPDPIVAASAGQGDSRAQDDREARWDVDYPHAAVEELRAQAERDRDPRLRQLADELDAQLARIARNEIDKAELLGAMEAAAEELADPDALSAAAGGQLDDVREAIRRLAPMSPRPAPEDPLALQPPTAQPPPPAPPPIPLGPGPKVDPPQPGGEPTPNKPGADRGWDRSLAKDHPTSDPITAHRTRDVVLPGSPNDAPSRRTTIRTAATKGFASKPYQTVYDEYRHVIEEVMRAEKMPASYRYYIKRYFRRIRPG